MKLLLILTMLVLKANPFTYGYLGTDTVLYSDPECLNAVTSLPKTYFVVVLEEGENYFKVSYKDISGYVKSVETVDYEPVTKYASATFTVNNDGYPVKLRATPTENSEVTFEIPANKNGYYYGDVSGSALLPQVGDKWHYVSYNDGNSTYHGYVYSSQVTVTRIQNNVIEKVAKNEESEESSPLQQNTDFILISLLCVPSVLIMYLIFCDKERKPRYKE